MTYLLDEDSSDKRMRLSLVLDSAAAPAWVAGVIRRLRGNSSVEIQSILLRGGDRERPSTALPLFYRAYLQWDAGRNPVQLDPLKIVDLSPELSGTPQVSAEEMEADAVVWLSERDPSAFDLKQPKLGVLRFVPADPSRYGGDPPYYWELANQEPVSGSAWEILTSSGKSRTVLATGFSTTEIGWSVTQNRVAPYAKAPALLEKALYNLQTGSPVGKGRSATATETATRPDARRGAPSAVQVGNFILQNARRSLHRRVAYRGQEPHWFIAYRLNPKLFVSRNQAFHKEGFRVVDAPKGRFFADPFPLTHAGRSFVFVEDYPYAEKKGVISVLEIGPDGQASSARRVLERPYHLSYPFVFEHEGSIFMIPETMGSHQIELYKATDFPSKWDLVHILKEDIDAVDTTLWIQNGVFYFFTNVTEPGTTPNELLHLYLADSLYGEWRPHPANPLCADVRMSRGAGQLFVRENKLIRPAQDCSVRYGYACQLNEVEALSTTEFRERPATRIEPDWFPGLIGTHTINSNDTIEVTDGQIYKSRHA